MLLDIPLLYESKLDRFCSKCIVVYVPPEIQLARLHTRNPELKEEAERRIASQMSVDEKRKRTVLVIDNSGSIEDTKTQVHEMYLTQFPHSFLFTLRNCLSFAFLIFLLILIKSCCY